MVRGRSILSAGAAAGAGAALAVLAGSAGGQDGQPTGGQRPPPQTGTIFAPPTRPALELNGPSHIVQAGATARVEGHSWWPNFNCKSPVRFTLRDKAGRNHRLGTLNPISGGLSFDSTALGFFRPVLADLGGSVRIPEEAAPGRATVTGNQSARAKLFVLPCRQVGHERKTARVEVLRARLDSRVIQNVTAPGVQRGQPIVLSFRLSRAGTVKVTFEFILNNRRIYPLATPSSGQRAAGVHQLQVSTLLSGHQLPAGRYRLNIAHSDPAGSTAIPAAPKSVEVRIR
jgi:hypothetical protein